MKPAVIMASKICETDKPLPTLEAFGTDVSRRRTVAGKQISLPRNSGARRSVSKQALLKAVEDAGGKW